MGCVCILKNEAMPDLIKIGFTTRTARERADELYRDGGKSKSGVPLPFEVAYEFPCENPKNLESLVHNKLSEHRINKDREFFKYSVDDAIKLIEALSKAPNWRKWTSHFLTRFKRKVRTY